MDEAPRESDQLLVVKWDGVESLAIWDVGLAEWLCPTILPRPHSEYPTAWMAGVVIPAKPPKEQEE